MPFGSPYSRSIRVSVTGGQANCVRLPAPPRGCVRRLSVAQAAGAPVGFTAILYSSDRACGAPDAPEADPDEISPDAFQVGDTMTVAAPAMSGAQYGLWWAYENNDFAGIGRRKTCLYLKLTPGGSGAMNFDVGYTVDPPI